jgi:hypothetical protein
LSEPAQDDRGLHQPTAVVVARGDHEQAKRYVGSGVAGVVIVVLPIGVGDDQALLGRDNEIPTAGSSLDASVGKNTDPPEFIGSVSTIDPRDKFQRDVIRDTLTQVAGHYSSFKASWRGERRQ